MVSVGTTTITRCRIRFFYSVALIMLFGTWALLGQGGGRLLKRLVGVVLVGAATNVVFALWQKATGMDG